MGSGDDSVGEGSGFSFAIATGLTAGRVLGPYRLVRALGEGAYAEVWLALEHGDHGFQKKVALKILKETTKDQHSLDSLINEARVCGMLHHPHIVDVYGVSQIEDLTFIAMEFVDGTTLEDLVERVAKGGLQLPLSVTLDIAIGIAEALDHAHNADGPDGEPMRIVHRDLKPGNVMLSPGAGVKVTDFGLAKATTNRNVTQAGQVRGTPGYIAPEVWSGTRDFTPGVDLWALGVMIWEMVCGEHLFDGTIIEVMGQAMNGDIEVEIGRLAANRPALARVTRNLLQRRPENRSQSAWETVVALKELRGKLHAPGGLDLFLELVGVGGTGRKGSSGVRQQVMSSQDRAWSQLITMSGLSDHEQHKLHEARAEARRRRKADRDARQSQKKAVKFDGPRAGMPPEVVWGVLIAVIGLGVWGLSRLAAPGLAPTVEVETVEVAPTPALTPAVQPTPEPPPEPATEAPTPQPLPKPTPVRVVPPTPTPAPEPTPAPKPTPAPAEVAPAAPTVGCLVFQSFPVGAEVSIDGRASGLLALGGDTTRKTYPPGPLTITMGSDGATLASATVQVKAGQRTTVRCDLIAGGGACTVRSGEGSCD